MSEPLGRRTKLHPLTLSVRTLLTGAAIAIAIAVVTSSPAGAQGQQEIQELRKQIDALAAGQAAIQKQLEELTAWMRARPAAPPAAAPTVPSNLTLATSGAPAKGSRTAKVTIIEFSDYQCPFCGRYAQETFAQVERDYVKAGKLQYVFRNLPLESLHPQAFKAHEAALCAGDQGRYWEMHDRLFADQRALDPPSLVGHASAAGLDMAKFKPCLDSGAHAAHIRRDLAEAERIGARGTPTFFIGLTVPGDSTVKVMRVLRGAQPYAAFREAIDSVIAAAN